MRIIFFTDFGVKGKERQSHRAFGCQAPQNIGNGECLHKRISNPSGAKDMCNHQVTCRSQYSGQEGEKCNRSCVFKYASGLFRSIFQWNGCQE